MDFLILIIVAGVAVYSFRSIRAVREDHRLAILRLGNFLGIKGPGPVFLIPIVDMAFDIDLSEAIPEWRGLTEAELQRRIMSVSKIGSTARVGSTAGSG
jgi:regulator of protease activity HflC (stomatin/prohibitin superfamily)